MPLTAIAPRAEISAPQEILQIIHGLAHAFQNNRINPEGYTDPLRRLDEIDEIVVMGKKPESDPVYGLASRFYTKFSQFAGGRIQESDLELKKASQQLFATVGLEVSMIAPPLFSQGLHVLVKALQFDFEDGRGPVEAYRHFNTKTGKLGGLVDKTSSVDDESYLEKNAVVIDGSRVTRSKIYGASRIAHHSMVVESNFDNVRTYHSKITSGSEISNLKVNDSKLIHVKSTNDETLNLEINDSRIEFSILNDTEVNNNSKLAYVKTDYSRITNTNAESREFEWVFVENNEILFALGSTAEE